MKKFFAIKARGAIILALAVLAAGVVISAEPAGKETAKPPLRVLVSGFEPFGGNPRNPTGELARSYAAPTMVGGVLVKGVELPVVYFQAWDKLKPEIESFHPDFILSLGLAAGEKGARLERVAINFDRGYPDNLGQKHLGVIVKGGEKKIQSDLPVDRLAEVLSGQGVPAYVSDDAGGYLCNHIFYQIMNYALGRPEVAAGFVHLPDWPINGEGPRLSPTRSASCSSRLTSVTAGPPSSNSSRSTATPRRTGRAWSRRSSPPGSAG